MNSILEKQTPKDLAAVGKDLLRIGGTYIVHDGVNASYRNTTKELSVEFTIESLAKQKNFQCSRQIEQLSNNALASLASGEGIVEFTENKTEPFYLFTNGSRTVKIKKDGKGKRLHLQSSIDQQVARLKEVLSPEIISTRAELSLTGREEKVCLIIRNETFSSISVNCIDGEQFFDPDSRDELFDHPRLIQQSYCFLKIGKENFKLQLYTKNNSYWLLTEVSPGLGIHCRILEKLTPHNRR